MTICLRGGWDDEKGDIGRDDQCQVCLVWAMEKYWLVDNIWQMRIMLLARPLLTRPTAPNNAFVIECR